MTEQRRGKYNARRNGQFDSMAEATRWRELQLMEKAGAISDLVVHPRFVLLDAFMDGAGVKRRGIAYEGDFQYTENGRRIVEDVKGVETQVFKLKRKLLLSQMVKLGIDELRIVKV